jgi:pimeloyl-ACP methyl ester carboxylesterase
MTTANLNGISCHYQSSGSGQPLLFIHGLGSCADDWELQVHAFAGAYRVIVPDLRGHGRSEQPAGPYSIGLFARDMGSLLEQLDCGPVHVVGLSLGGAIAFQLALDYPQLIRTVTIVNSGPELILRTLAQKFAIAQRLVLIRLLGLPRFGSILARRLFPDPTQAEQREIFSRRFRANRMRPYLDSLRALVGWSVTARLQELQAPVLVVSADQDYSPIATKEAYVKLLPNARLEVIANSRHATPSDQPKAFNDALARFLAENP